MKPNSPLPPAMQNLPPLWSNLLLVYFRAEPADNMLFPNNPFDLFLPGRKSCLVLHAADLKQTLELPCRTPAELNIAMEYLNQPAVSMRRVVTIHALSVLGRLVRWHGLRTGTTPPQSLTVPSLIDLVDRVNSPAALAYSARMAFRVSDYTELLQLQPEPGTDPETGLLLDLLKRYGN